MTSIDSATTWTIRLAETLGAALSGQLDPARHAAALAALTESHATGTPAIDATRLRILALLAERDGLLSTDAPLLPSLQALAKLGLSLVAADHGPTRLSMAAVRNWLTSAADEVVLVDANTTPPLTHRLRQAGLTDPRLRVIRLDIDLPWAQALNIGLRASRHARLWLLSDATRLATPAQPLQPLPAATFACTPDQPAAASLLIDLHRSDLARANGLHAALQTVDGATEHLLHRLTTLGLTRQTLPPGLLTTGPKPAPPAAPHTDGTLRDALLTTPGFAAMADRHIAALAPDTGSVACRVAGSDDLGQHMQPAPTPPLPADIQAQAIGRALAHLMQIRLGGQPALLSPDALDLVLNRPAADVSATDIAVAASSTPGLVATRKAWLVLAVAPGALPLPGTPAAHGLTQLAALAAEHQQTPVLVVDTPTLTTPFPTVPAPHDTQFWPTELRELGRPLGTRAPRHASMDFNHQTLADLQQMALAGPALLNRRPKIFIDAQHGLGNRMRAIASAGAIAQGLDRELVIIWQPDEHCACTYDDLFFPHGAVLTQGFAPEARAMGMRFYNYMDIELGAVKDAPITMGAFEDVYIRSAFPLISPCSNWHTENLWLRNMQPNQVVRGLVASVRAPNDLSLHIRMEGGTDAEHLPYESAANWTAQAHLDIDHWRKRSHFRYFLPRLDALIAQGLADRVFLATDTPSVYAEFEALYGKRVTWLPRPTSDRSAQSIVYALADALLLGRAPRLLGSTWSSFSELAARLSPAPMTVELTGRDF